MFCYYYFAIPRSDSILTSTSQAIYYFFFHENRIHTNLYFTMELLCILYRNTNYLGSQFNVCTVYIKFKYYIPEAITVKLFKYHYYYSFDCIELRYFSYFTKVDAVDLIITIKKKWRFILLKSNYIIFIIQFGFELFKFLARRRRVEYTDLGPMWFRRSGI